ncbi:glycoside hydrolase family 108 protein [Deinococcus kurensis]|uniref:glycoside hydrolase family 108 protein n=1 Tax=Deinococcus kurensis TaxID=2662757 RepID=UPI0012D301AF|nr:glycosyl hydrolase 108 family protein [Deinococcus kurensis]
MTTDFERAHQFTQAWEGGYVNHPADKGGPTNLGVTQAVWEAWCRERGLPVKPMKFLTIPDVLPLYEARYWRGVAHLPWPLNAVAYDLAVNHGPGNLRLMLADVGDAGTPHERAARLIDRREAFFRGIVKARPNQKVFLKGWLRRVDAQRDWLAQQAPPRVLLVPQGGGEPVLWDGRPALYGGVPLTPDLIENLRLAYPAGAPRPGQYMGLRVYHRSSGDLVLERA